MKQANSTILEALTTAKVIKIFQKWKEQKSQNAMFKAMMKYLDWVEAFRFFVAATWNADLELHLQAGEALSSSSLWTTSSIRHSGQDTSQICMN